VTSRPTCPQCERPASHCLCRFRVDIDNAVEVLILQHPLEQRQSKGSARLLQLCLRHCHMVVGECFDEALFDERDGRTPWLLYPAPPGQAAPTTWPAAQSTRLVVLDATWRHSRKLLLLNPRLLALPRLSLVEPPASRYGVMRKAHADGQLSTLEATALALQRLEGHAERYAPLALAFEGFIAQQTAWRG
jgi:DTW domain-containing protein YfiP